MAESNKICCSKYCKPPIYCTLINRVPQYTGLQFYPPKQALCVNQCKLYPDLPCFSNYRARFLSPRGLVNQGLTVFRWVATIFYHRKTLVFILSVHVHKMYQKTRFPLGFICMFHQGVYHFKSIACFEGNIFLLQSNLHLPSLPGEGKIAWCT